MRRDWSKQIAAIRQKIHFNIADTHCKTEVLEELAKLEKLLGIEDENPRNSRMK